MKKKLGIATLVAVLFLLALLFWPFAPYKFSRVHPRIQSLQQPYQQVRACYYLDGGSVGIEIVDRQGQKLQLAIPIDDGPDDTRTYHRLYIGALHCTHSNAVETAFSEDTKRYLADVISHYATGPDRDSAIIRLRGSPRDYVGIFSRALVDKLNGK